MNSAELLLLADRIEKAEGPDRELDAEIVVALDLRPDWCRSYGELFIERVSWGDPVIRANSTGGKQSPGHPPIGEYLAFTASLDAAMTLVPEGWGQLLDSTTGVWIVEFYAPDLCVSPIRSATNKSLALALTAASLRALASGGEQS